MTFQNVDPQQLAMVIGGVLASGFLVFVIYTFAAGGSGDWLENDPRTRENQQERAQEYEMKEAAERRKKTGRPSPGETGFLWADGADVILSVDEEAFDELGRIISTQDNEHFAARLGRDYALAQRNLKVRVIENHFTGSEVTILEGSKRGERVWVLAEHLHRSLQ